MTITLKVQMKSTDIMLLHLHFYGTKFATLMNTFNK